MYPGHPGDSPPGRYHREREDIRAASYKSQLAAWSVSSPLQLMAMAAK